MTISSPQNLMDADNPLGIAVSLVTTRTHSMVVTIMFASTSKSSMMSNISFDDLLTIHSPLASYKSVTENLQRLSQIKNFTLFEQDLAANKLPQWMFITPNMSMLITPSFNYLLRVANTTISQ